MKLWDGGKGNINVQVKAEMPLPKRSGKNKVIRQDRKEPYLCGRWDGHFNDKGLNRATVKRWRKMCLANTIQKDSWVVILISGKQTSEQERLSETKRVAIILQEYITTLNVYAPNNTMWKWMGAALLWYLNKMSESPSVMSSSFQHHGLYSPWAYPGQTTGVGNLSLLQDIFPTQGLNAGLPHGRWILYCLSLLKVDSLPAEPQGSPGILE